MERVSTVGEIEMNQDCTQNKMRIFQQKVRKTKQLVFQIYIWLNQSLSR